MKAAVRTKLKELVQQLGEELCSNAVRVEGLLRDYCSASSREISVLVDIVQLGIAAEMLQLRHTAIGFRKGHWISVLYEEDGIDRELALWGVESWLAALGIERPAETREADSDSENTEHPGREGVEVAQMDKSRGAAWYCQGVAYGKSGDHHRAIVALRKAIASCPDMPDAYFALGVAYFKIGCYDQAKENFQRAIRLNPSYGDNQAYRSVANLLVEENG